MPGLNTDNCSAWEICHFQRSFSFKKHPMSEQMGCPFTRLPPITPWFNAWKMGCLQQYEFHFNLGWFFHCFHGRKGKTQQLPPPGHRPRDFCFFLPTHHLNSSWKTPGISMCLSIRWRQSTCHKRRKEVRSLERRTYNKKHVGQVEMKWMNGHVVMSCIYLHCTVKYINTVYKI